MAEIDTTKITRFEVIDIELGRVFVVPAGYASLTLSIQDEGRTLKCFLKRPSMVDIAYNDVILTQEEADTLKRLEADKSCRPRPPITTDHIITR